VDARLSAVALEDFVDSEKLLSTLRELLRDVLDARFSGVAYAKLSRATGYADGYMRALLDSGMVDRDELLALVGDERRRFIEDDDAADSSDRKVA
jgi:hypothetical protein